MRKPRRLSAEELTPFQWQMPRTQRQGRRAEDEQATESNPSPPVPSTTIDWSQLYGNTNPVEIEVGMGKGLFLLTSASNRPDTNFFGIEIVRKYQLYATTRFAIRGLPNIKTVCADAKWLFRQFVPQASVSAVHVYFPDPWWKARHKKRRVFTAEFATDVARILNGGGRLLIATDVEEYFTVMSGIVRGMTVFREVETEMSRDGLEVAGYQTNFERKARQKGTPVWRATFERVFQTSGPESELSGRG